MKPGTGRGERENKCLQRRWWGRAEFDHYTDIQSCLIKSQALVHLGQYRTTDYLGFRAKVFHNTLHPEDPEQKMPWFKPGSSLQAERNLGVTEH